MKSLGGGVSFSRVWTKEKESLRYCFVVRVWGGVGGVAIWRFGKLGSLIYVRVPLGGNYPRAYK